MDVSKGFKLRACVPLATRERPVQLIVQPEAGLAPVLSAIKGARQTLDVVIFRFDLAVVEQALATAVSRGVAVRTLIAHTNSDGEKRLRKLEQRLLAAGIIVARTADDLVRYHGKLIVVDRRTLHLYGFNFTHLDMLNSRSFGVSTRDHKVVQEALRLFDADAARQPYVPGFDRLVVSPENARTVLATFIRKAQHQLLVYDTHLSDRMMVRLIQERVRAGVEVRILGRVGKRAEGLDVRKFAGKRLHVRAMVRDGRRAFIGSQSLRALELDKRREVGLIIRDQAVVKRMAAVFEADWRLASSKEGDDLRATRAGQAVAAAASR